MAILRQPVKREKAELARQLRRSMTEAESILWGRLRKNQLGGYHFRRQQVIMGFVVDFYCHAARLVVEVDGPVHDNQRESDEERERVLTECGLKVLRFTNAEVVENVGGVLSLILGELN